MKITYDRLANAAYITLALKIEPGGVAKTYTCNPIEVAGQINLDFDASGKLIGIEVMDATRKLPMELLQTAIE